jgi:hypothetical protein
VSGLRVGIASASFRIGLENCCDCTVMSPVRGTVKRFSG